MADYGNSTGEFAQLFWFKAKQGVIETKEKSESGQYEKVSCSYMGGRLVGYDIVYTAPHQAGALKFPAANEIKLQFAGESEIDKVIYELKLDMQSKEFEEITNRLIPIGQALASYPPVYIHYWLSGDFPRLSVKDGGKNATKRYDWWMSFDDPNYPRWTKHPFRRQQNDPTEAANDYRLSRRQWINFFIKYVAPHLRGPQIDKANPQMLGTIKANIEFLRNKQGVTVADWDTMYGPHTIREIESVLFNEYDRDEALAALNQAYAAAGGKKFYHLGKEVPEATAPTYRARPQVAEAAPAADASGPDPGDVSTDAAPGGMTSEDDLPF